MPWSWLWWNDVMLISYIWSTNHARELLLNVIITFQSLSVVYSISFLLSDRVLWNKQEDFGDVCFTYIVDEITEGCCKAALKFFDGAVREDKAVGSEPLRVLPNYACFFPVLKCFCWYINKNIYQLLTYVFLQDNRGLYCDIHGFVRRQL